MAEALGEPTVFLIKVAAGTATLIDLVPFAPAAGGGAHVLRLEHDDDRIWVSLDGAPMAISSETSAIPTREPRPIPSNPIPPTTPAPCSTTPEPSTQAPPTVTP